MQITYQERRAIITVARKMMYADGVSDERERMVMEGLLRLTRCTDVPESSADYPDMDTSEAILLISSFSLDKKRLVSYLLISVMRADLKIDRKEQEFLIMVTDKCALPKLSPDEWKRMHLEIMQGGML